jgi:hypothetical protein
VLTPFHLTLLGLVHTLLSVGAVVLAFVALARDQGISPRTRAGQAYLVVLVLTILTGLPIFRSGRVTPPHVLGILILVALAVAAAARPGLMGRASVYVRTLACSFTVLLLMIATFTETLTRVPPGAPLVASPEAPIFPPIYLGLFVLYVAGAVWQVRRLRQAAPASNLVA